MRVGEIWQDKDTQEKVEIDYIEYCEGRFGMADDYYVGYTYLEKPLDHETPEVEEMVVRSWFVSQFIKCRIE